MTPPAPPSEEPQPSNATGTSEQAPPPSQGKAPAASNKPPRPTPDASGADANSNSPDASTPAQPFASAAPSVPPDGASAPSPQNPAPPVDKTTSPPADAPSSDPPRSSAPASSTAGGQLPRRTDDGAPPESRPTAEEREQHALFIEALEKYGAGGAGVGIGGAMADGREWERMAAELRWTVAEVKVYAYKYMVQLLRHDSNSKGVEGNSSYSQKPTNGEVAVPEAVKVESAARGSAGISNTTCGEGDGDTAAKSVPKRPLDEEPKGDSQPRMRPPSPGPGWSYEECILFDALLARFGPDGDGDSSRPRYDLMDYETDGSSMVTRWERIAAMLPYKTSAQCRDRFEGKYSGWQR